MISGESALATVNQYRERAHDNTTVEALSSEFPDFANAIGLYATWLLRADQNESGTFKWRGAIVGATTLAGQGANHLIVPSAGNHARGAVCAARELDLPITVVVPESAPAKKCELINELWDDPRLTVRPVGDTFNDSLNWALKQTNGELLHPFGEFVIPGQGTVVDDILAQQPSVKTIVTPVGGGGLATGILRRLTELDRSDITVIGAEAEGSNSLSKSLALGRLTPADAPNLRYGGSAVLTTGQSTLDACRDNKAFRLLPVPDTDVRQLIEQYQRQRAIHKIEHLPNLEPTTLVAVAALKQQVHRGETVVVATGRNDSLSSWS